MAIAGWFALVFILGWASYCSLMISIVCAFNPFGEPQRIGAAFMALVLAGVGYLWFLLFTNAPFTISFKV